jgi:hypothetical protein
MEDDVIRQDLANLQQHRPDVFAILEDDPSQGFPPTEDLIEVGLFSQLEDGLLYLPQGAQDWLRERSAER